MGLVKKLTSLSGFFMVLLFLVAPMAVTAQWQGPTTILALTEGDGPNQVGVGDDELTINETAKNFCVDDEGDVIIADSLNARILIFGADGTLKKVIPKPVLAGEFRFWPGRMLAHSNGQRIFVFGQSECVYDFAGNIHKCFPNPFGPHGAASAYAVHDGFILNQSSYYGSDDYWSVDLEGNLVGKLPERPLELGRFVIENGKKYLKFPGVEIPADAFWGGQGCHLLPDGNVYCEGYSSLYNSDGVKIGAFERPADELPPAENGEFSFYVSGQVDQQGNIYLVKYSLDHYSILKWTYVGPEATAKPPRGTPEGDAWRYERYTEGSGKLPYDKWYSTSRGGRPGGPGHQEIQQRLRDQGLNTEVPFGNRAADAAGPREIHEIGGLNKRGDPISRERGAIKDILESPEYGGEDIFYWNKMNPSAQLIRNPHLQSNWGPTK